MRRIRRATALILSICLLLLVPMAQVSAEEDPNALALQQAEHVDTLINEIGSLRAQLMLCEADETAELEARIENLESQLVAAGGEVLSEADVAARIGGNAMARAVVPGTTSTVQWYSSGVNYIKNGITYRVNRIYGQARSTASSLGGFGTNVLLFDRDGVEVQAKPSYLSIYAQKFLGGIKILEWAPYELMFNNYSGYTGVVSAMCTTSYMYLGTACFCFVYPVYEGVEAERLTYVSTSFTLSGSVSNVAIVDEQPYSKSVDFNGVITAATDYASVDKAISYYETSSTTQTSYVHSYKFYDYNGTVLHQIWLFCPGAMGDVV